jgi:hypothetical protein
LFVAEKLVFLGVLRISDSLRGIWFYIFSAYASVSIFFDGFLLFVKYGDLNLSFLFYHFVEFMQLFVMGDFECGFRFWLNFRISIFRLPLNGPPKWYVPYVGPFNLQLILVYFI